MNDTMLVLAGIALVAILVLVVVTFFRLGSIVRDRDGAAREATDLRARFEAFAQAAKRVVQCSGITACLHKRARTSVRKHSRKRCSKRQYGTDHYFLQNGFTVLRVSYS